MAVHDPYGQMQELLLDVWRTTGTTILLVTHDVDEAVFLSPRIHVLSSHPGRVMEVAVPFDADRTRAARFWDRLRRHAGVPVA